MDLNNLERGELQNLQNQETNFDQNAMWENLEEPKKKRRLIFWFWFGGTVGVILLLTGLFFYNSEKNNSEFAISEKTNSPSLKIDEDSIINFEKNDNLEKESVEEYKSQTTLSEKEMDEIKILKTTKSSLKITEFSKVKTISSDDFPSNLETKDLSTTAQNITAENLLPQSGKEKNESDFFKQTVEAIDEKVNKNYTKIILPQQEQLPLKSPELIFETELKFEEFEFRKPVIRPAKKRKFTLSAFAGIAYQFKTLELKEYEANSEILDSRNTTESLLESLAFGFDIDKNIGKRWLIGTGIEMIVHAEKMMLENRTINNVANLDPSEIPDQYIDREGFLIRIKDSIYYNQHRLINLPIRLSYLINLKKIRLLPEASLVFNVSQKSAGHFQNKLGKTEEIATYFKNRIGLGYRFGCKVLIPAGRQFSLYAKPSFEWNPNDVSSAENSILQRRNLMRLDFGLSRSF